MMELSFHHELPFKAAGYNSLFSHMPSLSMDIVAESRTADFNPKKKGWGEMVIFPRNIWYGMPHNHFTALTVR